MRRSVDFVRDRYRQRHRGTGAPVGTARLRLFLIDVFCLGVKDVFYAEITPAELRSRLAVQDELQLFRDVEPAYARRLIRDAAAYAAGLGLPAANDTPVVEGIFGGVDAGICMESFPF